MNPQAIKEKNTKYLNDIGIEVIDWLPLLELTEFRKSVDVAKRSVILAALYQLKMGAPNDFIENYLKVNDLYSSLTSSEQIQLTKGIDDWNEQERIDLDWSIEAIWAFQWAGGKHNTLTLNTFVENSLASMLPKFHENEPAQGFINNFELLPQKKIFTELDKFFRAHWYARQKYLTNLKDEKVNLSIIIERRKALEYICDITLDWDDIPLNT